MFFKKGLKLNDYSPKTDIEVVAIEFFKFLKTHCDLYMIGGYPRELLMNKFLNKKFYIKDIDFAVKKKSADFKKILDSLGLVYKILNEDFGVFLVTFKEFSFEVACFRKDLAVGDGRRPKNIKFTRSMKKDSSRRDFTMNAFYFNPIKMIIYDFHNGFKDIKNQNIKFIGNTKKRIQEDYLRILRFIRFKNKYNFNCSDKDYEIIKKYSENILKISNDRIRQEFEEILQLGNINTLFYELDKTKILDILFPEIKKIQGISYKISNHLNIDIYTNIINSVKSLNNKITFNILKKYLEEDFLDLQTNKDFKDYLLEKYGLGIIWSILLHDLGKINYEILELENGDKNILFPNHEQISLSLGNDVMKRFNLSKKIREEVSWIIINHNKIKEIMDWDIVRQKQFADNDYFIKLIIVLLTETVANYESSEYDVEKNMNDIMFLMKLYKDVQKDNKKIKEIINFELLQKFNIEQGSLVGIIYEEVKRMYLEGIIKSRNGVIKYLEKKTGIVYIEK